MKRRRSRVYSERSFYSAVSSRAMPVDEKGIFISTEELNLAPSHLNPDNPHNWSVHHGFWPNAEYMDSLIGRMLVNLERHHTLMLNDQHNMGRTALHSLYLPPPRPTLTQAYNAIHEAFEAGEGLEIKRGGHGYETIPLHRGDMAAIEREYTKIR